MLVYELSSLRTPTVVQSLFYVFILYFSKRVYPVWIHYERILSEDLNDFLLCLCVPEQDLTGLKCSRLLAAGQVLPSECLSGLLEVAIDPKTNHALTSTIVSLLANLGRNLLLCFLILKVSWYQATYYNNVFVDTHQSRIIAVTN